MDDESKLATLLWGIIITGVIVVSIVLPALLIWGLVTISWFRWLVGGVVLIQIAGLIWGLLTGDDRFLDASFRTTQYVFMRMSWYTGVALLFALGAIGTVLDLFNFTNHRSEFNDNQSKNGSNLAPREVTSIRRGIPGQRFRLYITVPLGRSRIICHAKEIYLGKEYGWQLLERNIEWRIDKIYLNRIRPVPLVNVELEIQTPHTKMPSPEIGAMRELDIVEDDKVVIDYYITDSRMFKITKITLNQKPEWRYIKASEVNPQLIEACLEDAKSQSSLTSKS